jgi:hypothetical protein
MDSVIVVTGRRRSRLVAHRRKVVAATETTARTTRVRIGLVMPELRLASETAFVVAAEDGSLD